MGLETGEREGTFKDSVLTANRTGHDLGESDLRENFQYP
jgi:hypothetical protein